MKFYTYCSQYGRNILFRGYENGRQIISKETFAPTLFVKSKKKQTEWKSLFDEPLDPIEFGDIKDAKEFVEQYKDVNGFEVHGMTEFQYQFINKKYPGTIQYDVDQMAIEFLDIEVVTPDGAFPDIATAPAPIVLIAMHNKTLDRTIVFGTKSPSKKVEFDYRIYKDENTMLREFILYWQSNYPDIVSGWNSDQFDFPYIINRITRLLGEDWAKKLSPFNIIREREVEIRGRKVQTYEIVGVTQLDYLDLYKKFASYSQKESYTLGFIAQEELGETKLEAPCESFREWYENYFDVFLAYNAHDAKLVHKLDNKLKLIDLAVSVAYMAKINYKEVFSPVRTWDVLIYNHLAESKIAPPPRKSKFASEFEGAYVKDPILRLYGWGMSFDFASLYPTIIRQWNLSPETLVRDDHAQITVDTLVKGELGNWAKYVKDNDYTIAANGSMYHRNKKGILPTMMEMLMIGRKVAKKEMLKVEQEYQITKDETLVPQISALNNRQLALKILANAGYGAITNVGFRYYELAIGEAITLTGQASDKHIEKSLDEYMNKMLKTKGVSYVTYADTDSVYLDVDPLVNAIMPNKDIDSVVKLLDKIGLEIQKGPIQNSIDFIYNECNCFEKLMDMKREAIYSRGLWTAKKRYALKVHNSEGVDYKPYKLKIMGLEIIKASTPQKVRKKLKDAVTVIFEQDESSLQQFVKDYQTEFATYPPEDMAFPRSVKDMDKWKEGNGGYKKGTPIHVRAAILYNAYYGTNIGQELMNGDKMKFISLKEPNIIKEDVIGFPSTGKMPVLVIPLPVDVDKMFNMTFIRPLEAIATAIGWSLEEKASLEDFFG